jgi:hypothetical protein
VLLAGIVFLNVALLEVNGSIARMDTRAADLARENSALRMRVARLGSSERIQREAAGRGFVAAAPGRVTYLNAGPGDAVVAARALERWPEPQRPANSPSNTAATAAPGGSAPEAASASGASGDSPSGAGAASDADTSSTGDSRPEAPASQSAPDDEVGAASP